MHLQHDIPSQEITGAEVVVPELIYTVPGRFKLKMTETTLTNLGDSDATVVLSDGDGADFVDKLEVIVPTGQTIQLTGIMRHFSQGVYVSVLTQGMTVAVSSSGYLC